MAAILYSCTEGHVNSACAEEGLFYGNGMTSFDVGGLTVHTCMYAHEYSHFIYL